MASWFGSGSAGKPDPAVAAQLEQQIEMMDTAFMQYPVACSP